MPPLISIVIPAYNVADYLPVCMDSLLPDAAALGCEVVLVDDGSTDATGALCDGYAAQHPFVRVIHQANGGLSAARNAGMRAACGEYLQFVDSDDWLLPGALQKIAPLLAQKPDVLLLNTARYQDGSPVSRSDCRQAWLADGYDAFLARLLREYPLNGQAQCFLVRRQLAGQAGLFFHEGILHEDTEWTPLVLCAASGALVLEEPVYAYRLARPGSIMADSARHRHLDGYAAAAQTLQNRAEQFAQDEPRRVFLLRSAVLCAFQRLLLAGRCGLLNEVCGQQEMDQILDLQEYLPRRFGLCVWLVGVKWGVRLYRRIWGDC